MAANLPELLANHLPAYKRKRQCDLDSVSIYNYFFEKCTEIINLADLKNIFEHNISLIIRWRRASMLCLQLCLMTNCTRI